MIRDRMTDPMETSSMDHNRSWLATFVLGAAAGAAVALLTAPTSGRKSRAWLKDGARKLRDGAEDQVDRAQDAFEHGKSSIRGAVEGGAGVLRDSVEAARDGYKRAQNETNEMKSSFGQSGSTVPNAVTTPKLSGSKP